jgi:general secretion pathway protein G
LELGFAMKILSQSQVERQLLKSRSRRPLGTGFTLIELMIVISIIMILIGIAAVQYQKSVQRAREATLKQDLQAMRQSIDNYTLDKQAAPQSLDDLVQAGYLRMVPKDPMTSVADWDLQFDSVVLSPEQSGTGLVDVHSHSGTTSPFEGTPYNQW